MKWTAITTLAITASCSIAGCQSGGSKTKDYRMYDTGEPKADAWVTSRHCQFLWMVSRDKSTFGEHAEFYKNGRLKQMQWTVGGQPVTVLHFHENGQLKSEERYSRNQLDFAVYYDSQGRTERTIGKRLSWVKDSGT